MTLVCSIGKGISLWVCFETLLPKLSQWKVIVSLFSSGAIQIEE